MPYREDLPGFMPLIDLQTLEILAQRVPSKGIIVELGSFLGRSSWALAKSCDPTVKVYCIDYWDPKYLEGPIMRGIFVACEHSDMLEQFKENVSDCPNIIPIRDGTYTVPWPEDRKVDLVFIDACHSSPHVDNDVAYWIKKLKPSGVLAGHDFKPYKYPDVAKVVMSTSKKLKIPFKLFGKGFIWAIDLDESLYPEHGWIPSPEVLHMINEVIAEHHLEKK